MALVEACESLTNTTPSYPMGWFSVARSPELKVGEVMAVKAFDRAMEIVPHVSHALLRRGQTFSEAGDCSRRDSKGYPAATEPVCRPRRSRRRISVANMTDAACNCYHTALDIEP